MNEDTYFHWLVTSTPTTWWHDSADPAELTRSLELRASGVTTNPFLAARTMTISPEHWRASVAALPADLAKAERAEAKMCIVVSETAARMRPVFEATDGRQGYACAQVNPAWAGDRVAMLAQARRHAGWAPNIAVKLPATSAGLDVLEECAAEGITTAITVSFTVPQVLAAAERFRLGRARACLAGAPDCQCFAVIMIGRLDDYLREVAQDQRAQVGEADIRQSGLAVTKRAYSLFKERSYEAVLLVAALRDTYHMTELAGAEVIVSVAPNIQKQLLEPNVPRETRFDRPIAPDVIARLQKIPEFVKAYEPDGMAPAEFITFGVAQRTLSQFTETGWKVLETVLP